MTDDIEKSDYNEFLKSIGGLKKANFLKRLHRDQLEPLLLLNDFNQDWRFLSSLAGRANREMSSITSRYEKMMTRYGIPSRIFETNNYYDSNGERYYLSFWKNENALTDIIVSAIINNENFWKNVYADLFRDSKNCLAPPIDTVRVKREKFYQHKFEKENGESATGKKGRTDIFVSYSQPNGSMQYLHVEHKIQHKLDSQQIDWYCQAASEYENIYFILITSKDEDRDFLYFDDNGELGNARDGRLFKEIEKNYSCGPIIRSHVDILRIFYNTIATDSTFHYGWVLLWLFEIVKNYRYERIIREGINGPVCSEEMDGVWEKKLMLDILEEQKNGTK